VTRSASRSAPVEAAFTRDALFHGQVALWQPKHGYRANVDAILLAAFAAAGRSFRSVVDLGAGVGSVSLALAHFGAAGRVELVEREPLLAELARRNLSDAGLDGGVHCADLNRDGLPRALARGADLVIMNPPFFEPDGVRPRREPLQRDARAGKLAPFLRAAALAIRGTRARVALAYPARSLQSALGQAEQHRLVAKRLRLVYATPTAPARLALIELRRAKPGGLAVETPLIEWSAPGVRSRELNRLIAGRASDRKESPRRHAR
jgi:tRNA1(Val) A37 N6-methylase TrmN6